MVSYLGYKVSYRGLCVRMSSQRPCCSSLFLHCRTRLRHIHVILLYGNIYFMLILLVGALEGSELSWPSKLGGIRWWQINRCC